MSPNTSDYLRISAVDTAPSHHPAFLPKQEPDYMNTQPEATQASPVSRESIDRELTLLGINHPKAQEQYNADRVEYVLAWAGRGQRWEAINALINAKAATGNMLMAAYQKPNNRPASGGGF